MGFSVSGATALLFVAFLLSFGTFYTATMGAVEQAGRLADRGILDLGALDLRGDPHVLAEGQEHRSRFLKIRIQWARVCHGEAI